MSQIVNANLWALGYKTMRAQLKSLHSPDVDLDSYYPNNADCFSFLLQAFIGPDVEDGEDVFNFIVCTPQWLEVEKKGEITFGANYIIVTNYNLKDIEEHLKSYAQRCVGDSWVEVANKIAKVGEWEFDNYQAY
ncbi:Imm8 family immunity protein [Asticcacaulis sp. ZE23SCel15]|uniref:Imm8 family immunity protein n=1 Tax=Asticcacaulis sp. ZE23SCel15 TaxID=3059027 RepID=UPI00265FFC72|nr:Imm8 family immunity protein [Asticcacaulis sp. ZE23SCel15]WKL57150.1 Imm8 family immunity protein [Asticcacaulis sp. ZE23SCel15]